MSRWYLTVRAPCPVIRRCVGAILLGALAGCGGKQLASPYVALVGTEETRRLLGQTSDTAFAAQASPAAARAAQTANESARSLLQSSRVCVAVFTSGKGFLAYATSGCENWQQDPQADGDALFAIDQDGRRVLGSLLMPGGIELVERR